VRRAQNQTGYGAGCVESDRRREELCGFLNFSALDTGGADPNALGCAFNDSVYGLQIQIPATLGQVMSVADPISEPRTTLTEFTHFRHIRGLLLIYSYELNTAGTRVFI
jgi:hypothetical protein